MMSSFANKVNTFIFDIMNSYPPLGENSGVEEPRNTNYLKKKMRHLNVSDFTGNIYTSILIIMRECLAKLPTNHYN